jgi:hypothetical protein
MASVEVYCENVANERGRWSIKIDCVRDQPIKRTDCGKKGQRRIQRDSTMFRINCKVYITNPSQPVSTRRTANLESLRDAESKPFRILAKLVQPSPQVNQLPQRPEALY